MALNYTLHEPNTAETGQIQTLPSLPPTLSAAAQRLALDTPSAGIAGPCELHVDADEDVWLDIRSAAADLDPDESSLILRAEQARQFRLPRGTWYIQAKAA